VTKSEPTQLRITVALEVDRLFTDYVIEMSPAETLGFMRTAQIVNNENREKMIELLKQIETLIPPSVRDEHRGSHHTFRAGREISRRIIYLRFLKVNFPRGYKFAAMLEVLERYAKEAEALYQPTSDDDGFEILFWWI
jgi:hypothetical protein